jgi:hypothetical protein
MSFRDNYEAKLKEFINANLGKAAAKSPDLKGHELTEGFRQRSKLISQLIARSWLPGGEEIKQTLIYGSSDEIKALLTQEGVDLDKFFGPTMIKVDWDTFYGTLEEIYATDFEVIYNMPYPPRPGEVTDEQLTDWVGNTNSDEVYPPYPYIPLTGT